MIEWFMSLDIGNKVVIVAAIISALGGVLVAAINGVFSILQSKKKEKEDIKTKYYIKQNASDNATQIGVQINNSSKG